MTALGFPQNTCVMEEYGIVGDYLIDGSGNPHPTDNVKAWNAIMARAKAGDSLYLPSGHIMFNNHMAALPDGVRLVGAGSTSGLVRNFSTQGVFLLYGASYCTVERVSLFAAHGTSGGILIGHIATDWTNCTYRAVLRDVVTSAFGNGTYDFGCRFDGNNGYPHYGSRALVIDGFLAGANCTVVSGLFLGGVNGISATNVMIAGGIWGLWMCGTADNTCNSNHISGPLNCSILTYSCNNMTVDAAALGVVRTDNNSVTNTFNCCSVSIEPELFGVNNHVYAGPYEYHSKG